MDNEKIHKPAEEWILQAEYDIETAVFMLNAGRYIYAVFMAHLALEKLFKGLYVYYLRQNPPRTHNLILLFERIETVYKLKLTDEENEFIEFLNEKSVPSRYPDVLVKVLEEFNKNETERLVNKAIGIIKCQKDQLKK